MSGLPAVFRQLLAGDLVVDLDRRRRQRGEVVRERKLTTEMLLWLFVQVAARNACRSLAEILALAAAEFEPAWTVTESAFCRARARFSPRPPAAPAWPAGRHARAALGAG